MLQCANSTVVVMVCTNKFGQESLLFSVPFSIFFSLLNDRISPHVNSLIIYFRLHVVFISKWDANWQLKRIRMFNYTIYTHFITLSMLGLVWFGFVSIKLICLFEIYRRVTRTHWWTDCKKLVTQIDSTQSFQWEKDPHSTQLICSQFSLNEAILHQFMLNIRSDGNQICALCVHGLL